MTERERLKYLIEIHGVRQGNQYFADFDCPFIFDNGEETRIRHIDVNADGDCYVIFDIDRTEKFYLEDLSDEEIEKILDIICK